MVTTSARSGRGYGMAAPLVAFSLLLSACQGIASATEAGPGVKGTNGSSQNSQQRPAPAPDPTPAVLDVVPADLATGVLPDATVTVKASTGTLGEVSLADSQGAKVTGATDANGNWTAGELLRPDTAYILTLAATGPDGTATTTKSTFRTLKPKVTATYRLIPDGGTVGVGMPAIVRFDSDVVSKAQKAEVEKLVKVTTVPEQAGAWGWLDDRQLMWRPEEFWKTGTKVTLTAPLHGVQTGVDKWIAGDHSTTFTIGSEMISTVDMTKFTMTVRKNGKVLRTIPVSTGRDEPEFVTRYGTKVIFERLASVNMDSATLTPPIPKGDPDYYNGVEKWNLKVTDTGEYLHSNPATVPWQGLANVSHGCTNMSDKNAQWMYDNSKVGDIVKYTGSDRAMTLNNGIGVWVVDFAGWKALSALA